MKSIFHIKCNTPEELRQEFLTWLDSHAKTSQDRAEHMSRTKKDQLINFAEARVYREVMEFWTEIIIDTKLRVVSNTYVRNEPDVPKDTP
jgi:hypothetical protein